MFYGLLYGDGNFWTFSFQIFMEIRNSEFSPESFSVLDKRLKNSLQSWNSNFAIHLEEIWYSEQRNKWFWKFYINFSIWSESEKLSVELSADIPFPKKLSIFFWSYFTLFFEQTWDTVGSITSRCSGRGSRPDPGDGAGAPNGSVPQNICSSCKFLLAGRCGEIIVLGRKVLLGKR